MRSLRYLTWALVNKKCKKSLKQSSPWHSFSLRMGHDRHPNLHFRVLLLWNWRSVWLEAPAGSITTAFTTHLFTENTTLVKALRKRQPCKTSTHSTLTVSISISLLLHQKQAWNHSIRFFREPVSSTETPRDGWILLQTTPVGLCTPAGAEVKADLPAWALHAQAGYGHRGNQAVGCPRITPGSSTPDWPKSETHWGQTLRDPLT